MKKTIQIYGSIMRCPHCQNEIYRIDPGQNVYYYGTPFRKCSFCGKEYIDENYHEMAITGIRDCDKKKPLLKGDGDNIPFEAGSIERERAASEHRLMTSGYPLKLLSLSSVKKSTVLTRNINKYLLSELVPYINLLWKKLNTFFQDFKVQNANSFFDRLTYEARDPNAVKHLTRQILEHYRLDSTNIVVDVKYTERRGGDPVRNRGSFSFHKSTPGGRIQIVIDSLYSEYDTVIAIALHECAHAFLREHGIELKTELENERLTDIAAVNDLMY